MKKRIKEKDKMKKLNLVKYKNYKLYSLQEKKYYPREKFCEEIENNKQFQVTKFATNEDITREMYLYYLAQQPDFFTLTQIKRLVANTVKKKKEAQKKVKKVKKRRNSP